MRLTPLSSAGLLDIDCHHLRHALFLHGHAHQLLRQLHGDLVVADEEELGVLRHFLDQRAQPFGIGVIQRRVHLVQQAERRRIELEQRKHQRHGGKRLFSP